MYGSGSLMQQRPSPIQTTTVPLKSPLRGSNFGGRSPSAGSQRSASLHVRPSRRRESLRGVPPLPTPPPRECEAKPGQITAPPPALSPRSGPHLTGRRCNIPSPWQAGLGGECLRPAPPPSPPSRLCDHRRRGPVLRGSHPTRGLGGCGD